MKIIALSLPLALLMATSVHADVIYQFTGTYTDIPTGLLTPADFTLTLPSPVVSGTASFPATFLPGPDLVCDGCSQINFFTENYAGTALDVIAYVLPANIGEYSFPFAQDAFVTNGVHSSKAMIASLDVGTLTVSGVPEPSAFWLLLSALAAILTIRGARAAIRRTRPGSSTAA